MAAQESADEVLFNALRAVWVGDSNRLGGGTVALGVRSFLREGDPFDNPPIPFIMVSISCDNDDGTQTKHVDGRAVLTLYTEQNLAHREGAAGAIVSGEQNPIAAECLRLYDNADLSATGTDWKFNRSFVGNMRQIESVGIGGRNYNRYTIPIYVTGRKVAAGVLDQLVGGQGSVTWTPGSGGSAMLTNECEIIGSRHSSGESFDIRPRGYKWACPIILSFESSVLLRVKVGKGSTGGPFIPDGIVATITIYKDISDTTHGVWTFGAKVFRTDYTISLDGNPGAGSPQTVTYELRSFGVVTQTN